MIYFAHAETHLSAVKNAPPPEVRFPRPLKNRWWPPGVKTPAVKRPEAFGPLTMLPRRYRLPGYRVSQVLGGQTIYRESDLVIKILPNQLKLSRMAVVIPAKSFPRAVDRNRLKRQLLAIIDPTKITPGFDIVVLVRRPRD